MSAHQKPGAILSSGVTTPSTYGPAPSGFVIEAILEGRIVWLIEPVPLEHYTFTFELGRAHVFSHREQAVNVGSSVQCGFFDGREGSVAIILLSDEYRAAIAKAAGSAS